MGHHPGRLAFRADRPGQWELVEQRGDHIDAPVTQATVCLDDGKDGEDASSWLIRVRLAISLSRLRS